MSKRQIVLPGPISKIFIYQKDAAKSLSFYEGSEKQKWIEFNSSPKDEGSFVLAHTLYGLEKGNGNDEDIVAEIKSFNGNRYLVKRTGEIKIQFSAEKK